MKNLNKINNGVDASLNTTLNSSIATGEAYLYDICANNVQLYIWQMLDFTQMEVVGWLHRMF